MMPGSKHRVLSALAVTIASLWSIASAGGQAAPQQGAQATSADKPIMAEQAFKNVQLLRGISVKEFMETMGFLPRP